MSEIVVSIIVPAYNVESYIERCLKSILCQTFTNFECIIINDGSTDKTAELAEKFLYDRRFKIFHKENAGLAQARWSGVQKALGRYIMFVDSDDWIEPDMVESLHSAIEGSDFDVISCGYYIDSGNGLLSKEQLGKEGVYDPSEALKAIHCNSSVFTAAWNKIYKSSLLTADCFPSEHSAGQDYYSSCKVIEKSIKVLHINKPLYHYIQNPESISKGRYTMARRLEYKYNYPYGLELMDRYSEIRDYVLCFHIQANLMILNSMYRSDSIDIEIKDRISGFIKKNAYRYLINREFPFGYKMSILLFAISEKLYIFVYRRIFGSKLYFNIANGNA